MGGKKKGKKNNENAAPPPQEKEEESSPAQSPPAQSSPLKGAPNEQFQFDFGGNKGGGFQFDFSNPQNQDFLRTIQTQLGGLVGKNSGYFQTLPQSVRDKVRALKKLQKTKSAIDKDCKRAMEEIEKQFNVKYSALYEKRSQYVNGLLEPKEEDLEGEEDEGIKIEEIKEGEKKKKKRKSKEFQNFG